MRGLNFRQLKDDQAPVVAVELERRLLLPCGDIAMGIERMVSEGRLSGSGYGWILRDFEDFVRLDLNREALGLPRG
jgi:hypothetical protein